MNNKHKNLLAVVSVLLITVVIVGFSVACNNNDSNAPQINETQSEDTSDAMKTVVNLSIKSDKDEYTLMSGNTGDIADITAEEFNIIAEYLKDLDLVENNEYRIGWIYSVGFYDNGEYHKLIVNPGTVYLDGKNYDVKNISENKLSEYLSSLGEKYFK